MSLQSIDIPLTLPDLWQQDAVRRIQAGEDVVVDAPTGAGKTYIFELLVESRKLNGQLIFTVPTRALANDKMLEWREKGWNVGIATGDIAENLDAPVIVATLETQKARLLNRAQPRLVVVDEYQMIADPSRGINYEMTIAIASNATQLLLLSGSVKNPQDIVDWLQHIGRRASLVAHKERPVPQEQYYLDALPDRAPKSVFGYWPRYIYRALSAGLDPILIFAPQRKDSERIAKQISASLPEDDPLELSPEQRKLAGESLSKLLKSRVAFHHSGLSYKQRAGVIEPLAKAGQLRVVVATTGLGAGINFSMRSVIVAERDYRQQDQVSQVRPDELLQMFGRAGRRGLDERGYVLVLPNKPRLEDSAPIQLKRTPQIDWPSFISLMHQSRQLGIAPTEAAIKLASSLFSSAPLTLGFEKNISHGLSPSHTRNPQRGKPTHSTARESKDKVIEILNSEESWERRKGPHSVPLKNTRCQYKKKWRASMKVAAAFSGFQFGTTCKLTIGSDRIYGKEWAVAHFPTQEDRHTLLLNKNYRKTVRNSLRSKNGSPLSIPKHLNLEELEAHLRSTLPQVTRGGVLHELLDRNGTIVARIDMSNATVTARKDSLGTLLLNPPEREIRNAYEHFTLKEHALAGTNGGRTPACETWKALGLIDKDAYPTARGVIFSFFNHGEGLAVAAALEDKDYPIEQLIWDLANLRTGHRFDKLGDLGSRLSYVCRETYGSITHVGYLRRGLPEDYGEGGSELVYNTNKDPKWKHQIVGEDISAGDIERVILEWKSILRQIANAPEFPCSRWTELQQQIREKIHLADRNINLLDLPPLSAKQRSRKPIPFRYKR